MNENEHSLVTSEVRMYEPENVIFKLEMTLYVYFASRIFNVEPLLSDTE